MSQLEPMRRRVAYQLKRWSEGSVQLLRDPDSQAGQPIHANDTDEVYDLDAVIRGGGQFYEGTEAVAYDLVIVASPNAVRHSDGQKVSVNPTMRDRVKVNGWVRTIKRVEPVPADSPAKYRIFVGA